MKKTDKKIKLELDIVELESKLSPNGGSATNPDNRSGEGAEC